MSNNQTQQQKFDMKEMEVSPQDNNTDEERHPTPKKKLTRKRKVWNTGLLVLKLISTAAALWDTYSAWEIFHYFITGDAGLPNDTIRHRVSIAWGVFAAIGVLTCILVLWDMFVESLEDFKIAGVFKRKRIAPHHELWITATSEELPQSIILMICLVSYSVTGPEVKTPSFLNFINESLYGVILDSTSIIVRLISATNKLFKIFKEIRKNPKAVDIAVIVVDIIEVLLLAVMAIVYTVIKNQKGL